MLMHVLCDEDKVTFCCRPAGWLTCALVITTALCSWLSLVLGGCSFEIDNLSVFHGLLYSCHSSSARQVSSSSHDHLQFAAHFHANQLYFPDTLINWYVSCKPNMYIKYSTLFLSELWLTQCSHLIFSGTVLHFHIDLLALHGFCKQSRSRLEETFFSYSWFTHILF